MEILKAAWHPLGGERMKTTNDKNCDSMDGDLEDETPTIGCGDDTDYGYYCHLLDNDELD